MMLHEFLTANRPGLIASCRAKVSQRRGHSANGIELEHGIPLFLDQLITTLAVGTDDSASSEMGAGATRHGHEMLQRGFSIDQVVHDYGDLCQAVTELASARRVIVGVEDFRTMNRCLDNAIAGAVTEFAYQRDLATADREV